MTTIARRILVRGVVQGVGFRPFVYRIAHERLLAGSVRNLGDAGVEILVEGPSESVRSFLDALETEVPPLARIDGMETVEAEAAGSDEFVILPSSHTGSSGGELPPDVATCDACVAEILEPSRFRGYWATSCTDCGPRFTVIESLPYDRPRTSMSDFPMCDLCESEYTNPLERRYHAQTTACDACGPALSFDGDATHALSQAIQALVAGKILAIKGIGGTHIACDATNARAIRTLRQRLGRSTQPFALMATESMVSQWAVASPDELEELKQPHRPILVLRKRNDAALDDVTPHLHTVGIMLPYSGLHHLLFESLSAPLIMTSANIPGQPMLIDNDKIGERLHDVVDHYLLHDRRIVARCDDSVRRKVAGQLTFLRRSRGFVPQGMDRDLGDETILALGPESDLTFALYSGGRITPSQHIGTVDDLETLTFLREAIDHLLQITGASTPAIIACDAHPQFLTSGLATELAAKTGARIVRVQHHVAHMASVMVEHHLDACVGIILDGYGYGDDGGAWGGEVFAAKNGSVTRQASLLPVRLPGGDLAAKHPLRMAGSLLYSATRHDSQQTVAELVTRGMDDAEASVLVRQLKVGVNAPWTTSAGRFLDAVSAWLGVCRLRGYEGEPAMRLEAAALSGHAHPVDLEVVLSGERNCLDVVALFRQLMHLSNTASIADVAATAQDALARGMAMLAMGIAEQQEISTIVLSGGVAYNDHIASRTREIVETSGYSYFTNQFVPCGDGGVSLGQIAAAGWGAQLSSSSAEHAMD